MQSLGGSEPARKRSVVVCDRRGLPLSTAGVLEAHSGDGILHKAFSAFVFRKSGTELLLQRRSSRKRTFPLLWSNTCCSHPFPADASICALATRRMREELGFGVEVVDAGAFVYRARDESSQLIEYEHDSVLIGHAEEAVPISPDPEEVDDFRWVEVDALRTELSRDLAKYSPWFPGALEIALKGR